MTRRWIAGAALLMAALMGAMAMNRDAAAKEAEPQDMRLSGVCFSAFRDNESPQVLPLPSALAQDVAYAAKIARSIRTYSVTGAFFQIPELCEKNKLPCHPGAWLDKWSGANNDTEIEHLLLIADKGLTQVKSLIVGNEALHRNDLTEAQMIRYIRRVKAGTKLPVTTAETWRVWMDHPKLVEEVDYIMVHIYPYWESVDIDDAVARTKERYEQLAAKYPDKRIVIGETGWPTKGTKRGAAVCSEENQIKYFKQFTAWAGQAKVDYQYFELFDEQWKQTGSMPEEAHWGLLYSNGKVKPGLVDLLPPAAAMGLSRPARKIKIEP